MWARVSTFRGSTSSWEADVQHVDEVVIPKAKQLEGFVGGYWLGDRQLGKMLVVTIWQSAEAMLSAEGVVEGIRQRADAATDLTLESVETYEVTNQA